MKKVARRAGALLVLAAIFCGGPRGSGQEQKTDNFVLIIDQSNEMNVPYGPKNESKNYTARKIAEGFILSVPDTVPVKGAIYMYGVAAKDAKNTVVRVVKMQGFKRSTFKDAIWTKMDHHTGLATLSWALKMVKDDLEAVPGRTAVIIISGGNKADWGKPSHEAQDLKQTYKDKVCIYTVQVGDSHEGKMFLKGLADDGRCGFAINAERLESDTQLRQWTQKIFFK